MKFRFKNCNWGGDLFESEQRNHYYTAFAEKLEVKDSNEETELSSRNPKKNVEALAIVNHTFISMPIILNQLFANLLALEVKKCGLSAIKKSDLKNWPHLKELWMWDNNIKELPRDLFEHSHHSLEVVSFKNNKIEFISKETLKPLKNLLIADFRENVNIDMIYQRNRLNKNAIEDAVSLTMLNKEIAKRCQREVSPVSNYVSELWTSGLLSDLSIKAGTGVFKVHKNVLAVNSPVFAAMFSHEMQENLENKMEILDISVEAIKEFLEFIYLRQLPKDSEHAIDLYAASAKYQIEELTKVCESLVLESLSTENVFDVFILGNCYNNDSLKDSAFSLMSEILGKKIPSEMMEMPTKLKNLLDAKVNMDLTIENARQLMDQTFANVIKEM